MELSICVCMYVCVCVFNSSSSVLTIFCIYCMLYFLAISAGRKRYKTANLKKIRRHYNQDTLREHIIPDESNRFRYFYHIRRANGDALSSVSWTILFLLLSIGISVKYLSYEKQSIHVYMSFSRRTTTNTCQCYIRQNHHHLL